eukprot:CAMPEP_0202881392 /NCGR_PEP_ID=MMETSP1391-20130828/36472_1 /ASSEMBLY_ACC=CAM_ASM_000867 /TAXON_ID=1034604 /ORGANISM="Chlamydomonas leiostraca, Strain SAG 11-49" /LENGTH=32 /DNA_ID= /DNA_START= /DNA_END= /DNA_ORIENTATION=
MTDRPGGSTSAPAAGPDAAGCPDSCDDTAATT